MDQANTARLVMGDDLSDDVTNLIAAAYAKTSWSKLVSAVNCLSKFSEQYNEDSCFPLTASCVTDFAAWCFTVKNLKSSTIHAYISSLATVHKLRNLSDSNCHNFLTKTVLKGVKNLELYDKHPTATRKVMTLPLLIILGNQIEKTDWLPSSKQIIWTAAVIAFFGSTRMGELLPSHKTNFCPEDTLLWSDVKKLQEGNYLIHVKIPKNKTKEGEFVDIFEFPGFGICPVAALDCLKSLTFTSVNNPVFMFPDGHCLTLACMTETIRQLLFPVLGNVAFEFACHSFRSAIPSAIGKSPDLGGEGITKGWGRWSSSAYLLYSRLKISQKREIFRKISEILSLQGGRPASPPPV